MLSATPLKRIWRKNRILNWSFVERDEWVRKLAADVPAGLKVIDIGAGSAPYRRFFAHCDYKAQDVGTNTPDQMRYGENYADLDYCSDICSIPVPDSTFDVAICTEVLEHVPDPIAALKEIARILKPEGKLILSFPLWAQVHYAPNHYYGGFSPYWIDRYLPATGFKVEKLERQGGFFKYYGLNSQRFIRHLAPWRVTRRRGLQLLYFPVYILLFVWYAIVTPLFCYYLDPLDETFDWTLGYYIEARRA